MVCCDCKQDKPKNDFHKKSKRKRGYQYRCKECSRSKHLFDTYGISLETYNEMLLLQNNVCAICKSYGHTKNIKQYPFHVDHDHKTGKVRGLLCASCNLFVGYLETKDSIIEAMKQYLAEHS